MKSLIATIEKRCAEQAATADDLLKALQEFGWKDNRPIRTQARSELLLAPFDFSKTKEIPATARIPAAFIRSYHEWYSGSLALVEANMRARGNEVIALHEGAKGGKDARDPMTKLLQREKMSFEQQVLMASHIRNIGSIVGSIPAYLKARMHDVELSVVQNYVRDQLSEAEVLLRAKFFRAAGAIAGVLLERHLKLLCDRQQPPIKYTKTSGIAKLNDLLREHSLYDVTQWRKVQWMGDVRNACDHAHTTEPRDVDVQDLIHEVRRFVSLFVV